MSRFFTISLVVFLFFSGKRVFSQELNCVCEIEPAPQLQLTATDKQIFESLKEVMFNFMNNTKWTDDVFAFEERIDCSLLLSVKGISGDRFDAQLQIKSTRPVFKTGYRTPTFSFLDEEVQFRFMRDQILQFTPQQHRDNLSSILAFYAYMIIGFDYDSFSLEGGTPYFNTAQQIVNNAQNAPEAGWRSLGSGNKNRYLLIDNVLHQSFKPLRKCNYEYHRMGMDLMEKNIEEGRANVATALQHLVQVYNNRPGSFVLQDYVSMKRREIINLFSQSFPKEKSQVINTMKRVDPANSSEYQNIMNTR